LLLVCLTAPVASEGKLYVIAHMANTRTAVDWAVGRGANAVELDLRFDDQGKETVFQHGGRCDCLCARGANSICSALGHGWRTACEASESPGPLLGHIAGKAEIALVIIDSKVGDLQEATEMTAGRRAVGLVEEHLFGTGYSGNVIISAAKLTSGGYLRAAAQALVGKPFAAKVFFSFDEERNKAVEVLTALRGLPSKARAFGTGISACLRWPLRKGIRTADLNRRSGSASLVYVWTLDRRRSMERYLDAGAQGIITNYPGRLHQVIKAQGGTLAKRSTLIPLATKDHIVERQD
jgi:hypothetical protein